VRDGFHATIEIVEIVDGKRDVARRTWDIPKKRVPGAAGGKGRAAESLRKSNQALSVLGHAARLKLLAKLLEGPATYRALQRTTKLLAGPLYHHINQLRLARLILPKQRDLYELTRGGRNVFLIALAAGPLAADSRRRP
jgi:DNA-binding HxlR family transcriptional regulator